MARAGRVISLLRSMEAVSCRCPAHGAGQLPPRGCNTAADQLQLPEYAFEMACSSIRYGAGVTSEVGMDLSGMGCKLVCVLTDGNLAGMQPVRTTLDSLHKHGVEYRLYDQVRVEPTDSSFQQAAEFARGHQFDAFLAVGGGSVIDTAKAANLYSCHPQAELLQFVNPPIGCGQPVSGPLKPLIAVPTTAGTGSETTGVAIFDYQPLRAKTGIASRQLRPTLGLVDPLHVLSMPERVACYSGLDVLCHALESYTALPYDRRRPRPTHPLLRPAYQGSNPVSDVWAEAALRIVTKFFVRSVRDAEDVEARSAMHLASSFAGVGFGNAGVHLCHGMSYPISGLVRRHRAHGYPTERPLIPHGLSVAVTAPAVFKFTAPHCPQRHLRAAQLLGCDVTGRSEQQAGQLLADTLLELFRQLRVEDGLTALGFTADDVPALVQGTLPQQRVTQLSPRPQTQHDLTALFTDSLTIY